MASRPDNTKTNAKPAIILAGIAVGLVVGLIAVGWKSGPSAETPANPTSSPLPSATVDTSARTTADWKVYRNERAGFEVSYPENLRVHLRAVGGPIAAGIILVGDSSDRVFEAASGVANDFCYDFESSDASYLHFSLEEFVQRLLSNVNIIKTPERLTIEGVPAIRLTVVGALPSCFGVENFSKPTKVIYADHDGERTQIIYEPTNPVAESILQTLRFIPIKR